MFKNCESLTELPDFSIWDISNLDSTLEMFNDCISLICWPNILKMADKFKVGAYLSFIFVQLLKIQIQEMPHLPI